MEQKWVIESSSGEQKHTGKDNSTYTEMSHLQHNKNLECKVKYIHDRINELNLDQNTVNDDSTELKTKIHLEFTEIVNLLRQRELQLYLQVDEMHSHQNKHIQDCLSKMHSLVNFSHLNDYATYVKEVNETITELKGLLSRQRKKFISNVEALKSAILTHGDIRVFQLGENFCHEVQKAHDLSNLFLQIPLFFMKEGDSNESSRTSESERDSPRQMSPVKVVEKELFSPLSEILTGRMKKESISSLDSFEVIETTENLKIKEYDTESAKIQKEVMLHLGNSMSGVTDISKKLFVPCKLSEKHSELSEWITEQVTAKDWKSGDKCSTTNQDLDSQTVSNPLLQIREQLNNIMVRDNFTKHQTRNTLQGKMQEAVASVCSLSRKSSCNSSVKANNVFFKMVPSSHNLHSKYWLQSDTKEFAPGIFRKHFPVSPTEKVSIPSVAIRCTLNSYLVKGTADEWLSPKVTLHS